MAMCGEELRQFWRGYMTRAQAAGEVERHGSAWDEFVAQCGDKARYCRRTVLRWLNCRGC